MSFKLSIDVVHALDIAPKGSVVGSNPEGFIKQAFGAGFNAIGILLDQAITMPDPLEPGINVFANSQLIATVKAALARDMGVMLRWNGPMRYSIASDQPYWYSPFAVAEHIANWARIFNDNRLVMMPNDQYITKIPGRIPLASVYDRDTVTRATSFGIDTDIDPMKRTGILEAWNLVARKVGKTGCQTAIQDLAIPMPGWEGRVGRDWYPNIRNLEIYGDPHAGLDHYQFAYLCETSPECRNPADIAATVAYAKARGIWANLFHLTAAPTQYWSQGAFNPVLVDAIKRGLAAVGMPNQ